MPLRASCALCGPASLRTNTRLPEFECGACGVADGKMELLRVDLYDRCANCRVHFSKECLDDYRTALMREVDAHGWAAIEDSNGIWRALADRVHRDPVAAERHQHVYTFKSASIAACWSCCFLCENVELVSRDERLGDDFKASGVDADEPLAHYVPYSRLDTNGDERASVRFIQYINRYPKAATAACAQLFKGGDGDLATYGGEPPLPTPPHPA